MYRSNHIQRRIVCRSSELYYWSLQTKTFVNKEGKSGVVRSMSALLEGSVDMSTLSYQNLLFCRVPIKSILGLIVRAYKKVGYGRLRSVVNEAHNAPQCGLRALPQPAEQFSASDVIDRLIPYPFLRYLVL